MTILVLAQKKILYSGLFQRLDAIKTGFREINRRGTLTIILIWLVATLATGYLGALYLTFQTGFFIRESNKFAAEYKEEVLKLELEVQEAERGLASSHKETLESMEKISGIKYVSPVRDVALSLYGLDTEK